ncbi:MAG TPA: hydantoinase/oxoprolinase family protein [Nitrososphaerales archaeon]|nr:hydantoinase/oxoprolinase family protein [Nitrososphaerales archaeon]
MSIGRSPRIFVGVDVGGTFTDLILYESTSKETTVVKVPTSSKNIEEAIIDALSSADPLAVRMISHATTTATNALLTGTGLAKTALVTNAGFRDVLEIGRQRRPEIYNLYSKRPTPLVPRKDRLVVGGRILHDGREEAPISSPEITALSHKLALGKYDCVVVGLLNSYANPKHEKKVAKILAEKFKGHIITSSDVDREYREYERISTAVVNAALIPLVSRYLKNLSEGLKRRSYSAPVYLMNSDGNVSTLFLASRYPISIIESGPAAGVLACADLARTLSLDKVATFDMGGTTAKAGMITEYEPDVSFEFEAAGRTHSGRSIKGSGYPVRHPFIDLAEVSAGGGTIAWVDEGGALRMGPQSGGAEPGPAAYGRGGVLPTVTDANIFLGRLSPSYLLGGKMKVYPELAMKAISEIARNLGMTPRESAQSMIRMVNHNMSKAISIVSVERGRDPREYTLVAFGGAGPLHACDLAEEMSITNVVIPVHPGLFSAYGLLTVDLARTFSSSVLTTDLSMLEAAYARLEKECKRALRQEEGASRMDAGNAQFIRSVDLRYLGQSYEITLPYQRSGEALKEVFHAKHKELYGYSSREDKVEAVNIKIRAIVSVPKIERRKEEILSESQPNPSGKREAWISGSDVSVPVFVREELAPGNKGSGPCIIEEYDSTSVINSKWSWSIDGYRNLILSKE